MTAKQLKALEHLIPHTDAELTALLSDTITTQTLREEVIANRDAKIAKMRKDIEDKYGLDGLIANCDVTLAKNMALLELWAERERKTRFGDAKSISIAGVRIGWKSIGWRTATLSKVTWAKACDFLALLVKRGDEPGATEMTKNIAAIAARFVRTKIEPNKDAMIAAREDAAATEVLLSAGVMIETEDHFFIRREGEGQAESTLKA